MSWSHTVDLYYINQKRSKSRSTPPCCMLLCHASRRACRHLIFTSTAPLILDVLLFLSSVSNEGQENSKGEKPQLNEERTTPSVNDTSHGLHVSKSQNDSDTFPHSNSQWYTTYDMIEWNTCVKNKIIKNGEFKHLNVARTPLYLKVRERGVSNNATDMTHHINRIQQHIHHACEIHV